MFIDFNQIVLIIMIKIRYILKQTNFSTFISIA